ncbi:MAG: class I SAM-dependent methyltransferase [Myxococcota bacterium]|nr:class I SAM-dependent methyltransferase [Myxococcota bacterium]
MAAEPVGPGDDFLTELLRSPCCGEPVAPNRAHWVCRACGHEFTREDGIARCYWPHGGVDDPGDVTERVKAFYEETPFPNYEEHDSLRSLIEKSRDRIYARRLDEAVPLNSTVLEVGCGTGQLSNFLGIACRRVVATDLCLNSLRLGETFRREHELSRVRFVQMNLFRPCLASAQFDVVLCNGVLHHTSDPFGGFARLVPLLRPGGIFVLGLYNRYGRLATDLRRALFRLTGGRGRWLDPVLRKTARGAEKQRAWFADQYRHPHESKHTMGEVLRWFERTGLEFVRGVPATSPVEEDGPAGLFEAVPPGGPIDRAAVQLREIVTGGREGGFFVMIGRRPGAEE